MNIWQRFLKLFGLCDHKWTIIEKTVIAHSYDPAYIAGHLYVLQCEKCGNIVKRKMTV